MLRKQVNRLNIDWQLAQIEPAIMAILSDAGAAVRPPKGSSLFHLVEKLPDDASPVAKDAVGALSWLDRLRPRLQTDEGRKAALAGLMLGYVVERMAVRPSEPHAARGLKTLAAAKKSHVKTHGTLDDKRNHWAAYQREVDVLRSRNPNLSYTGACHRVAERNNVHYNTVRNHTQK